MPDILAIDWGHFLAAALLYALTEFFKWRTARRMETTVKKVEQRGNHLEELNLEHFVDLYEELLYLNPQSETAGAKLAAARQKLADHRAAEKRLERQGA